MDQTKYVYKALFVTIKKQRRMKIGLLNKVSYRRQIARQQVCKRLLL